MNDCAYIPKKLTCFHPCSVSPGSRMPQSDVVLCSDSPCLLIRCLAENRRSTIAWLEQKEIFKNEYRMSQIDFMGESLCMALAPGTAPMGRFSPGDFELLSATSTCSPMARLRILYAIAIEVFVHTIRKQQPINLCSMLPVMESARSCKREWICSTAFARNHVERMRMCRMTRAVFNRGRNNRTVGPGHDMDMTN